MDFVTCSHQPPRSTAAPLAPIPVVECDHSGCPALAVHEVDLYDQDFFFCHHHWVELSAQLSVAATGAGAGLDHERPWAPPCDPIRVGTNASGRRVHH